MLVRLSAAEGGGQARVGGGGRAAAVGGATGHAHSWSARRDMCRGIHALRGTCLPGHAPRPRPLSGTCPALVPSNGHNANMPIPGPRRGTCPAGFQPSKGHVQCWSARPDMCRGIHAFRGTCLPGRAQRPRFHSAGHAQCWSRAMDIMPICPSLARARRDMPSGTCPTPCEGHAQRNQPQDMSAGRQGHVPRVLRAARDMSSGGCSRWACPGDGQEATPPALPGPRAIRVQGLRVRRPVPGVSR